MNKGISKAHAHNIFKDEGVYSVPRDLPSGEYYLKSTGEVSYYGIYNDSNLDDICSNDNFNGSSYISVKSGQYIEVKSCVIYKLVDVPKTEFINGSGKYGMYKCGRDINAGEYLS